MAYFTQTEGLNLDRLLAMAQDEPNRVRVFPDGRVKLSLETSRPALGAGPSSSCNTSAAVVTRAGNMAGLITSQQTATWRAHRGILWAVVILLALVLAACSSTEPEGPPAVARVDGKPVTLAQFNSRAAFMGLGGDPALLEPELRQAVVEDLVGRALILAEAERQGSGFVARGVG